MFQNISLKVVVERET